jgi:hypothetical protein
VSSHLKEDDECDKAYTDFDHGKSSVVNDTLNNIQPVAAKPTFVHLATFGQKIRFDFVAQLKIAIHY